MSLVLETSLVFETNRALEMSLVFDLEPRLCLQVEYW